MNAQSHVIHRLNETTCEAKFLSDPYPPTDEGQVYCNSTWDGIMCIPTTLGGTKMRMKCPDAEAFSHIGNSENALIDTSQNATRLCSPLGVWENRTNYDNCLPELEPPSIAPYIIYFVGYSVSTIALVLAVFIFLYFKNLRCLRNTIHCHLMVSFILRNISSMILYVLLDPDTSHAWPCKMIVTLYNYFTVTNFFWMFVEGLYLHTLIVWAFTIDKIKFWQYVFIGWVLPVPFVIIWIILKTQLNNNECWMPEHDLRDERLDWLLIAPTLLVLLVNLVFVATIIWVLITKLRSSITHETQHYRKAVKATIILVPLLGLTYVFFISKPGNDEVAGIVIGYANAVLMSTQSLWVAMFYCFFNGEVQTCIQKKFSRWKDSRSISHSRWTKASTYSIATTRQSFARSSATQVPLTLSEHNELSQLNGRKRDSNWNAKTNNDFHERKCATTLIEDEAV